ncbi:hypothetical protein [Oceanobacillus sp. CF4.6]|uniref:hypothetical protein n=1 Tax=Oceanobacillus sp. CF4.6 TaxID=3373080 RepID=UPI003EE6A81F
MDILHENILHLPDWQFVCFCRDRFGLNKGVYNTIDTWFYENGIINITERRKQIVYFLDSKTNQMENGKLKFGPKKLNLFLSEHLQSKQIV